MFDVVELVGDPTASTVHSFLSEKFLLLWIHSSHLLQEAIQGCLSEALGRYWVSELSISLVLLLPRKILKGFVLSSCKLLPAHCAMQALVMWLNENSYQVCLCACPFSSCLPLSVQHPHPSCLLPISLPCQPIVSVPLFFPKGCVKFLPLLK